MRRLHHRSRRSPGPPLKKSHLGALPRGLKAHEKLSKKKLNQGKWRGKSF